MRQARKRKRVSNFFEAHFELILKIHHHFPHSTNANWDPLFFSSGTIFLHVTCTNFMLIPDSGRFSSAGHDGKRRAPSSSPRPSPCTAVRCLLLAGCDLDSAPICFFVVGVGAGIGSASSNSASPSPVPLAQPASTCWLASHTCCILYAYFKLRGAPMLQEPSVTACGVSSPCDKIEKSLLPISFPAADVRSPATAQ